MAPWEPFSYLHELLGAVSYLHGSLGAEPYLHGSPGAVDLIYMNFWEPVFFLATWFPRSRLPTLHELLGAIFFSSLITSHNIGNILQYFGDPREHLLSIGNTLGPLVEPSHFLGDPSYGLVTILYGLVTLPYPLLTLRPHSQYPGDPSH